MNALEVIDQERQARGWKWADLARALDVSPQVLVQWRKRGVPRAQYPAIARALGISIEALAAEDLGHKAGQVNEPRAGYAPDNALRRLINAFAHLDIADQTAILRITESLAYGTRK